MPVVPAYALVVLIWSTTPLAIQWSNHSVSFIGAVSLRMLLAAVIAGIVLLWQRRAMRWDKVAVKLSFFASLGIFPPLTAVYWSAQYVPSGVISVLFGLSPFITGIVSIFLLRENPFTIAKCIALLMAVGGLAVIFLQRNGQAVEYSLGFLSLGFAVVVFSISGVLVKGVEHDLTALEQTFGALLFSLPGFIAIWLLLGNPLDERFSMISVASITYLGVFGSLLGFAMYFFILQNLSVNVVGLIPLMTPVFALWLGYWLNNEMLSDTMVLGSIMVLVAMLIYQQPWKGRKAIS